MTPVDFNVFDLLPMQLEKNHDLPDNFPIFPTKALTTGYGCHGQGVRLVGMHSPSVREVVSEKEFGKLMEKSRSGNWGNVQLPQFRVQDNRIFLDLISGFYNSDKLSSLRYPTFEPCGTAASLDLTDRLAKIRYPYYGGTLGIDFAKTLEAYRDYKVKRK